MISSIQASPPQGGNIINGNIIKKWKSLNLDMSVVSSDYESVHFLLQERLIYTIAGLKNSSQAKDLLDPIQIREGSLFILSEGSYIPVQSLLHRLRYDEFAQQWRDSTTGLLWLFILPKGLTQVDRCSCAPLLPVTTLSEEERLRVLKHAQTFKHLSFSEKTPPKCVLQIVTDPKNTLSSSFLFDGIKCQRATHIFMRIIDEKGNVYSTGLSRNKEENRLFERSDKNVASINGAPATGDWEDFRPHNGRRVTSVPMTQETCTEVLHELNEMRAKTVRFNFLVQNCSTIAVKALDIAGVKVDHHESIYNCLWHLSPSIPVLRTTLNKILKLSHRISKKTFLPSLDECGAWTSRALSLLLTPLRCFSNLAINCILIQLGAKKGSFLKENGYTSLEHEPIRRFSTLVSSCKDFFATPIAAHSSPVIAWQDAQKSTLYYTYKSPNLNILPEEGTEVPSHEKRPYLCYLYDQESRIRRSLLTKKRKSAKV